MARVSWIHISDLHFKIKPEFRCRQDVLGAAIAKDIRKVCERQKIRPSFLFVTGDLVYGRNPWGRGDMSGGLSDSAKNAATRETREQFEYAFTWLKKLRAEICDVELSWCGKKIELDRKRVFCVPGNHDVNWSELSEPLRKNLGGVTTGRTTAEVASIYNKHVLSAFREPILEKKRHGLMSHLGVYREALEDANLLPSKINSDLTFIEEETLRVDGTCGGADTVNYRIIGINTAWGCTPEFRRYPAILTCADAQLRRLLTHSSNVDPDVTILCMHHPVSWMWANERAPMRQLLNNHVDFVLRGHEHVEWISPFSRTTVELATGATFGAPGKELEGYLIVEFDTETRLARVFPREIRYRHDKNESQSLKVEVNAKNPRDMRDRDGGIVIPLAKGEALGDEENTLAAVRRLGFRTGKFELIGEQTQEDSERHPQDRCIGVVVTADIMRFSQLNASLQVKAVSALWDNLSRALAERQSNTTVAFSPLSDGIQVAFRTEPGESGLRAALDTIDTTHLWMLRGANAPDVRYGVACGDFSVVAPPSLLPVTVVGAVANLSRKLAYRSGPGIVAFSKPAWNYFVSTANSEASQWEKFLVGTTSEKDGDGSISLEPVDFLSIAETSRPIVHRAISLAGIPFDCPNGRTLRHIGAVKGLKCVLEKCLVGIRARLLNRIGATFQDILNGLSLDLGVVWHCPQMRTRSATILRSVVRDNGEVASQGPVDNGLETDDSAFDEESCPKLSMGESISRIAYEKDCFVGYFGNGGEVVVSCGKEIDPYTMTMSGNMARSVSSTRKQNELFAFSVPGLQDSGLCGGILQCYTTAPLDRLIETGLSSYHQKFCNEVFSDVKEACKTLEPYWETLHLVSI